MNYRAGEVVTISRQVDGVERSYRITNPGEGRIGSKISMGTPYEKDLLVDVLNRGHKGTAFDVGAHIGNHSLWFAGICGLKVIAWEPYEESRDQLTANLALNPSLDITVLDWAAGDQITTGRFTSGMWLEFDPTREGDKLHIDRGTIPVYPIDHMVDISNVSVVKIDVEGMEPHVLRGMRRHLRDYQPTVYAETHSEEAHDAVEEILGPLRYEMTRPIQMGSLMERWEVV